MAEPMGSMAATHGSNSVPVPVTLGVLMPMSPARLPSQSTMGADAPP